MSGTRLRPLAAVALLAVLALGVVLLVNGGTPRARTLSVDFPQAVSIYRGSDVDVMGVRVGRVTAVVPEGATVRVDIEYDGSLRLPADARAAIVTPTLVADRFIQLAPAYGGGPELADGGHIPVARTAVPVELDRIYGSLEHLTRVLGPHGANRDGSLSMLLHAGAEALRGNGALGNQMLTNLSGAVQTLGANSGTLFGTIDRLSSLTQTLDANDKTVGRFMTHLADVSSQLAGERGDLRRALVAIASALDVVRNFVHDNKGLLVSDLRQLTTTLGVLARQKDTLGTVLQLSPLGLGNLANAFDDRTGTVGIRLQAGPAFLDLGNTLCDVLKVNRMPDAGRACTLLKALLPRGGNYSNLLDPASAAGGGTAARPGAGRPATGLAQLLGGGR